MTEQTQSTIDRIKEEIDALPPEHRILARYVEALHAQQSEQIADVQEAFSAARFGVRIISWFAVVGGGVAAMWAAFHGRSL
jgi:hypothetical protein